MTARGPLCTPADRKKVLVNPPPYHSNKEAVWIGAALKWAPHLLAAAS